MIREAAVAVVGCVVSSALVAVIITVGTGLVDRHECESNGGTFYVTSTVWGCR
jgi:site-specific recombinase